MKIFPMSKKFLLLVAPFSLFLAMTTHYPNYLLLFISPRSIHSTTFLHQSSVSTSSSITPPLFSSAILPLFTSYYSTFHFLSLLHLYTFSCSIQLTIHLFTHHSSTLHFSFFPPPWVPCHCLSPFPTTF